MIPSDVVKAATEQGDLVSAKGAAGTAVIFGDCLIHGSPPNLSPWTRSIFSLILNPISNHYTKDQRADHFHHRDLTPVKALPDGCLTEVAAASR